MKKTPLFLLSACILLMLVLSNISYSSNVFSSRLDWVDKENHQDTVKTYTVDEVVVTGTRTLKKIIDIPYSVERIDESQYKYDRKISVDDVLSTVPGLFLQNRYGNHDVRISIRGFGSRSNSGIRGVRILLDGIPESEPDGQTRIEAIDFNSIGSIELVKGNSSSLYTNAPGGVINFINDINFDKTSFVNFNEFGSFGLRRNGFKSKIKSENYNLLTTYTYHNSKGYRNHSDDYWHILNTVLATRPNEFTRLNIYGYFVDGKINLPGSLTKAQFDADLYQPNKRDVDRDSKRISKKGRVGVQWSSLFGENKNTELDLTTYGTIKYFERTAKDYRIINRTGIGATGRFVNKSVIFDRENELSVGGDLFNQSGPIETYDNIGGKRGDGVKKLTDETIANTGFYFLNTLSLIRTKMDLLVSGRYDKVIFDAKDRGLDVRSSKRVFEAFTPKAALNYKITQSIALYTSYGLSFDSPAGNELENYPWSSDYPKLLNPDLKPQQSNNFEIGIKGALINPFAEFIDKMYFEATVFNSIIKDEIVPFDVTGQGVFYRNAAKTNRNGIELGTNIITTVGIKFKGAYTYSNFKYDEYIARTIDNSTGRISDVNFSDKFVPSVPQHNFSSALSYDSKLTENITGFIKGHYMNISGMYVDDQNTERTNKYQLVNSTLGLDILLNQFNVLISGGVNNIFNKKYAAFININSDRKEFYEAGEPRNYFASINLGYTF